MTQPRQTRCFKQALARVQHLFMETRGVKLTATDAALMAGLDKQVCRVSLRNLHRNGLSREGPEGPVRPQLVGFALTVTVED